MTGPRATSGHGGEEVERDSGAEGRAVILLIDQIVPGFKGEG